MCSVYITMQLEIFRRCGAAMAQFAICANVIVGCLSTLDLEYMMHFVMLPVCAA